MLHPTLANHQTPYSMSKTKKKLTGEEFGFFPQPIEDPFYLDLDFPLAIISINLARFPFTPSAPEMLYNFIAQNPVNIFCFQEVQESSTLRTLFDIVNSNLIDHHYVIHFSNHKHDRTFMAFAWRETSISVNNHNTLFRDCFLRQPTILRPPDHLLFTYKKQKISLINLQIGRAHV